MPPELVSEISVPVGVTNRHEQHVSHLHWVAGLRRGCACAKTGGAVPELVVRKRHESKLVAPFAGSRKVVRFAT